MVGLPDHTCQVPDSALAPALFTKSLPARVMVVAVSTLPLSSVMPLPAVGPLLTAVMLPAVMLRRLMSPLVAWVLPAPSRRVRATVPVPALMLVPLAMVMTAAPASRLASTAPLAVVSFAVSVRLPLSVVMLALSKMDRPACRVSAPPLPPALLAVSAVESVMSLLACSVTAVPASSRARMALADKVLLPVGLVAKVWGLVNVVVVVVASRMSTRPAPAAPLLFQLADRTSARPSLSALTSVLPI